MNRFRFGAFNVHLYFSLCLVSLIHYKHEATLSQQDESMELENIQEESRLKSRPEA